MHAKPRSEPNHGSAILHGGPAPLDGREIPFLAPLDPPPNATTPAPNPFAVAEKDHVHMYTLRDAPPLSGKRYHYDFSHSVPRGG